MMMSQVIKIKKTLNDLNIIGRGRIIVVSLKENDLTFGELWESKICSFKDKLFKIRGIEASKTLMDSPTVLDRVGLLVEEMEQQDIKIEYLIRPSDCAIFKRNEDDTFSHSFPFSTNKYDGDRLLKLGFKPAFEENLEEITFLQKVLSEYQIWTQRPDGHGGVKGGELEEFITSMVEGIETDKSSSFFTFTYLKGEDNKLNTENFSVLLTSLERWINKKLFKFKKESLDNLTVTDSLFTTVFKTSAKVQDNRSKYQVLSSIVEEVGELSTEVRVSEGHSYKEEGKDGVIGEALDIIAGALDMIYITDPEISEQKLVEMMKIKCEKWYNKTLK